MARSLADGAYEQLITAELAEALGRTLRAKDVAALPAADAPMRLARFLRDELMLALGAVRAGDGEERIDRQLALANKVIALLRDHGDTAIGQELHQPARELRAIAPTKELFPPRPETGLSSSALLTMGPREPRLGNELVREFASADRVDALIAFVTRGGVRQLDDAIDRLVTSHRAGEPPRLRILTTTYTGATELAALNALALRSGVEVRVSFDDRRTRLHAKAWLFHRASGLSTAYVGSANLSAPALVGGLEWTMKTSAAELPAVVDKFAGAFETLWADAEFEPYHPSNEDAVKRLRAALGAARTGDRDQLHTYFTLTPYPYQQSILDRLHAERTERGFRRNLVVAATGTGKTLVAAFDYAAITRAAGGVRPRLLFIAHTRQILVQARAAFRTVLRDGAFGELLTGEDTPVESTHLFATIQTLRSRGLTAEFGVDYWQHVVVDECHHMRAHGYQAVIPALRPEVLLGLTATPERADGRSLLVDFDGRIAAELRLWHALEHQLLAPFEYYGLDDGVGAAALARLRWVRGRGYDTDELSDLYTGNHARADLVLTQLARKTDVTRMRALGFCVSVAHAEFMAAHFVAKKVPAVALSGASTSEQRNAAQRALETGELRVIFTCDLFNEGIDLPFVDTLLLLRPTESATIFLQQLGRGLRLHPGKSTCLVLDFIGQHREEFRFDTIYAQLTGLPRARLSKAVEAGFPFLPSGCSMALDKEAHKTVLRSLRTAVEATWKQLVRDAASLAGTGRALTLPEFLADTGHELLDLYRSKHGSWARLCRDAGVTPADDADLDLCHDIGRLLHVDDSHRLARLGAWLDGAEPHTEPERREALMLGYLLEHDARRFMAAEEVLPWIRRQPAACDELRAILPVLAATAEPAAPHYPVAEWPLALHRHYERREILTACGVWTETRKVPQQQGVERIAAQRRELLFVTLDKSDGGFSPTTRYRDYAISADRFHWETQNAVAAGSDRARHYAEHVANGWSMHLFVQTRRSEPFAYLGAVTHKSQQGSRPVQIVWRLSHPLPAALLDEYRTLAQ